MQFFGKIQVYVWDYILVMINPSVKQLEHAQINKSSAPLIVILKDKGSLIFK